MKYLINVIKNQDIESLENFESNIIPQPGTRIITNKYGNSLVKDVVINYKNIQHENLDERGTETIFVFI